MIVINARPNHWPNPGRRVGQRHVRVIIIPAGNKPCAMNGKTKSSSLPWDIVIYLEELVAEVEVGWVCSCVVSSSNETSMHHESVYLA